MAIRAKFDKEKIKKIFGVITSPLDILRDFASEKYDVVDDVLPDVLATNTASLNSRVDKYIPGKGFVIEPKNNSRKTDNSRLGNSSSRNFKYKVETPKPKRIDDDLTR